MDGESYYETKAAEEKLAGIEDRALEVFRVLIRNAERAIAHSRMIPWEEIFRGKGGGIYFRPQITSFLPLLLSSV